MLRSVIQLLQQKGYQSLSDVRAQSWYRETDDTVWVLVLSSAQERMDREAYRQVSRQVEYVATTRFHKKTKVLHLIFTKDGMFEDSFMNFLNEYSGAWVIAADTGRIYIFENQPNDFDELYQYLEQGLMTLGKEKKRFLQPVNMGIVLCNVLYFLLILIWNQNLFAVYDTDIMVKMGALTYENVRQGQWYRMVTSLFMHFGWDHLFNNMVLLVYAGNLLEQKLGHMRYFILYMLSGLLGNAASLWYYAYVGEDVVSAGASGAIFGVLGALFVWAIQNRSDSQEISVRQIVLMVVFTIYYGLTTIGVDNAAHIGGLLGGIVVGFVLSKISRCVTLEKARFMR